MADIVQDTILTCFEKLPTLREEKYFKTWMMKIVINHCKNFLRKEKRIIHMETLPEETFVEREYSNSEWNEMLGLLDESTGRSCCSIIWRILIRGRSARFWT